MKKAQQILSICALCLFFLGSTLAQSIATTSTSEPDAPRSQFKHAINVCPVAPVFGIYALNYEYLFTPKNGIVARVEYEDVPKAYTDANIESNGWAFSANYRRHFAGELNSLFLGAYTRYRFYNGDGHLENSNFEFTLKSLTVGLNAGKRWVWNSGFNITFSLGYGYSFDSRDAPSEALIQLSIDQLEKEYDFMSPFFGELSAGYAF